MKIRILALLVAVAALVAIAVYGGREKGRLEHQLVFPAVRTFPRQYVGIVSYNLYKFDVGCGCTPNIAARYIHIGGRIDMISARETLGAGAVPLLELEPYTQSLASIAAGADDQWLTQYARAVASLNAPVIMSFAPEANGDWYSWSYRHAPAAAFVAAWQHVVTVFRLAGVTDVRWAWIMNVNFAGSENIASLWPGSSYVNILGLDGYFTATAPFQEVFGPTIVDMRTLSADPLLITETAAAPAAGKLPMLREIISGVSEYGLSGFIWFDVKQQGNVRRQNWLLEDDPAALQLFGRQVDHVVSAR
jgi:mannan endo-1,4-beta-mannosidase